MCVCVWVYVFSFFIYTRLSIHLLLIDYSQLSKYFFDLSLPYYQSLPHSLNIYNSRLSIYLSMYLSIYPQYTYLSK